jgi:hypothetical protein
MHELLLKDRRLTGSKRVFGAPFISWAGDFVFLLGGHANQPQA